MGEKEKKPKKKGMFGSILSKMDSAIDVFADGGKKKKGADWVETSMTSNTEEMTVEEQQMQQMHDQRMYQRQQQQQQMDQEGSSDQYAHDFSSPKNQFRKVGETRGIMLQEEEETVEYVDEDGNPVNMADYQGEVEYVDEHGNPVNIDAEDVEYVDEDGNPVDAQGYPLEQSAEGMNVNQQSKETPREQVGGMNEVEIASRMIDSHQSDQTASNSSIHNTMDNMSHNSIHTNTMDNISHNSIHNNTMDNISHSSGTRISNPGRAHHSPSNSRANTPGSKSPTANDRRSPIRHYNDTNQDDMGDSQGVSVELVDEDGNVVNMDDVNLDDVEYVDEDGNPVDINGNPLPNKGEAHAQTPDDNRSVNSDEVHYVDENGNPINPDDVEVEYVDEFGNIVDPDTLDDDVELVNEEGVPLPSDSPFLPRKNSNTPTRQSRDKVQDSPVNPPDARDRGVQHRSGINNHLPMGTRDLSESLDALLGNKDSEIADLTDEVADMQEELAEMRHKYAELKIDLKTEQDISDRERKRIQALVIKNQETQADYQDLNTRFEDAQVILSRKEMEIKEALEANVDLKNDIEKLEEDADAHEDFLRELDDLKRDLDDRDDRIEDLEQDLREANEKLDDAARLAIEKAALIAEIAVFTEHKQNAEEENEKLQTKIENFEETEQELKKEVEELKEEVDVLKRAQIHTRRESTKQLEELEELKQKLIEKNHEVDDLTYQLNGGEDAPAAKEAVDALHLERQIEALEKDIRTMQHDQDALQYEITYLKEELEEKKTDAVEALRDASESAVLVTSLSASVTERALQIEELEKQLQEAHDSKETREERVLEHMPHGATDRLVDELRSVQEERDDLKRDLDELKHDLDDARADLDYSTDDRIIDLEDKLADKDSQIHSLEQEVAILSVAHVTRSSSTIPPDRSAGGGDQNEIIRLQQSLVSAQLDVSEARQRELGYREISADLQVELERKNQDLIRTKTTLLTTLEKIREAERQAEKLRRKTVLMRGGSLDMESLRTDLGNSQEKDIAHILMDIDENCDEVEVILTEKEEDMEVMEADIQNLADELRRYEKQKSNTGVKLVPIVLV